MSSPEVTITLGRTGQVVTKGGKRSRGGGVRSNDDSFLFSANKRYRGDGGNWNPVINGVNGSRISPNDLRLKLMHKRQSKKIHTAVEEQRKIKPQKKLLKAVQPPIRSVDSLGKFHSYQTMEVSRARSPDQILKRYSRQSPPQNFDGIQKVMRMGTENVSRRQFLGDEIIDASRLRGSSTVIMKSTSQAGNSVTLAAPTGGIMQVVPNTGEEPLTVTVFLHSLGLGKYVVNFRAEEVDMTALKQMGDKDLKEMGIPMGPRKKILLALMARMKQQMSRVQH